MAQLAAGSIMDEFNSAFRQVLPAPSLSAAGAGVSGAAPGGYTPSLLSASTVVPPIHSLAQQQHYPPCAAGAPPAPAGRRPWLRVLGWLGLVVVGVIVAAVFVRQRMFVRVESNHVPLITDRLVFTDNHVEPEVPPRVELVEETVRQDSGQRVHFEDEIEPDLDPELQPQPEPESRSEPNANSEIESEMPEADEADIDPNFTPMKLDAM